MKNSEKTLDMIVNLCKSRGYVYAGSEIYGGLANSWDYGPLGVEFKNNVKKAWLKKFVQESDYNVGLDAAIIMNPTTWVTTGHVGSFSDPLVDCKGCGSRFWIFYSVKIYYTHFSTVNQGVSVFSGAYSGPRSVSIIR